jgi:hypothetical protein
MGIGGRRFFGFLKKPCYNKVNIEGNMNDRQYFDHVDTNPNTARIHQREVLWQITIPFIVAVIILLVFAVITVLAGIQGNAERLSAWADTSLIWLILPTMLFTLIFSIVLGGLLYLVVRLIHALPRYTYKLHQIILRVNEKIRSASDTAAKPVIKTSGFWASVRALLGR